jgi:16S rRNA (adenine1518-N6/adenine1519-N6)-dimethyltransferase
MRYLGQHFLKNKKYLKLIAKSLEIKSGDLILEIGPGHGELTLEILKLLPPQAKLIAIEKDSRLFDILEKKFKNYKNLKIIKGDALKLINKLLLNQKKFKIAGNIPYYITGKLLRIISELKTKPEICVFTLQKEVGERILSTPPLTNKLSAITLAWAYGKIIKNIPAKEFLPPPKVDSVIIVLNKLLKPVISLKYAKMVNFLFKHPRKTILNNLLKSIKNKPLILDILSKLNINPKERPQNLSVDQILKLSLEFKEI